MTAPALPQNSTATGSVNQKQQALATVKTVGNAKPDELDNHNKQNVELIKLILNQLEQALSDDRKGSNDTNQDFDFIVKMVN